MHRFCFVVFAIPLLSAEPRALLQLSRQGSLLAVNGVYLNHRGPFRMLIDTGCSSSSIPQSLARRIGVTPAYSVEQETPAGITRVGATLLDEVTTGPVTRKGVEVLI